MAVRIDEVHLRLDFITDESRKLASTLLATKEYNKEIDASTAKIKAYERELQKVGADEAKRVTILAKIAAEEKNIATNLAKVAAEGKKVEALDLGKLAPAQLIERAKQLAQAIRLIPASAPEFGQLQGELARVNTRLREINATSKGIQDAGAAASPGIGGFFGSVVGKVTLGIAAIQAAWATLQGLFSFAKAAVTEFRAAAQADTALISRIESTGGAAGRTLEQLKKQAGDLQKVTFFTDEQTAKGQEILLTFTNVRDEIFDRTIPAAQDLSTVFGQQLQASAVQLGKALNDPVRGVTALRRVGISFSADQEKMIKSLVETNRLAEAQAIILQEVEREVGGAARAAAEAAGGPYTLLQQRLGEVQEGFGELISRGLDKLRPAFEVVVTVLEKVTGALLGGEKATGKYSGVANATVFVLKALGSALSFLGDVWNLQVEVLSKVYDGFVAIYNGVARVIEIGKSVPVLGAGIRFVADAVGLLSDLFQSFPATFAGFQAAAGQAVTNVKAFFTGLITSAKILAKELELALTIDGAARDRLNAEITALKKQQSDAAAAGKTIGEAYTEARNKALADGQTAATEENKKADAARRKQQEQEDAAAAEARRKAYIELQKKQFEAALKEVEADAKRRELILENARIKDQISEERYQEGLTAIRERELTAQLEVYKRFRKDQENEAQALRNRLAEIQQGKIDKAAAPVATLPGRGPGQVTSTADNTGQRLEIAEVGEEALLKALQDKFTSALISEQEYHLQKLEIQRLALAQEIAILQSATQPQVEEIKKREEEKRKVEGKIGQQRLENDLRLEALKQQALQEGTKALGDVFSIAADLLGQDEKRKQKHAGVVKALQIAQIQVNLAAEVSGIFANAQQSAIAKLLGPVAGTVLAFIQAAAATVRAGLASAKVQSQKFARGTLQYARTGIFGGKPHSAGGTKGYFEDGTQVEVESGEAWAVVNKKNTPLLRALSFVNSIGGHGKPFFREGGVMRFDTGGLPSVNTTPAGPGIAAAPTGATIAGLDSFVAAVVRFERVVAAFPTEVKSRVVYTELEETGDRLATVRDDAAI